MDSDADHEPLAEVELGLPPQALREIARASTAGCNRYRITGTLADLDERNGLLGCTGALWSRRMSRRIQFKGGRARPEGRIGF
jgi:hypothetical protein